jgi:hypothetical protein
MRAFDDGRFLETAMNLSEDAKRWLGFCLRRMQDQSVMYINDKGEWTELHEITIGSQPSKRFMEMALHRQR